MLMLGPSGSGKSTLLNILGGNIPRSMDIPFKADVLDVDTGAAYVFQDPDSQFTMPTVVEELAFILENRSVPQGEMDEKIQDALKSRTEHGFENADQQFVRRHETASGDCIRSPSGKRDAAARRTDKHA